MSVRLETLIKSAIFEAIKENKKMEKKSILYNTEVLLRNYLGLKWFYENVSEGEQIVVEGENEDIIIRSIMRNKMATKILLECVDKNLKLLQHTKPMEFRILKVLYLDRKLERTEFSDKMDILGTMGYTDSKEIFKIKNRLIEMLGVTLFGAEGLRFWTV